MEFRKLMILVLVLALGPIGVAQDLASDVGKGAANVGKATGKGAKEAARGAEGAAKATAHGTKAVAKDTARATHKPRGTKKAGEKNSAAHETAGGQR